MAKDKSSLDLAQAILAPVDAIMKAQVHAARSFLNLMLQIGFPHRSLDKDGKVVSDPKEGSREPWCLDFVHKKVLDGEEREYLVRVPTLATLPLNPLAITEAEVEFKMSVEHSYEPSYQFRQDRTEASKADQDDPFDQTKRPWYLIDNPVTFRGHIAPSSGDRTNSEIAVKMKIGSVEVTESLGKFLTLLGEFSSVELNSPTSNEKENKNDPE